MRDSVLRPLPRYPKVKDAKLLYSYMAKGLYPYIDSSCDSGRLVGLDPVSLRWIVGVYYGEDIEYLGFAPAQIEGAEILYIEDINGNKIEGLNYEE
jgi:hypothetical protein